MFQFRPITTFIRLNREDPEARRWTTVVRRGTTAPVNPAHRSFSVLQVLPALETGGVEQTTLDVAAALVARGGRALVASAGGRLEGPLKAVGGEHVHLPLNSKNPLILAANARSLWRLTRQEGVDLIHARSRAPAFSALYAARHAGVPFVTTYHGVYNARSALKRWYNSVMTRGDITIANSEFTLEHIVREHGAARGSLVAIPRGVDLARFDPDAVSLSRIDALRMAWGVDVNERRLVLLLAGRLTRWKGQRFLIDALGQLRERTGRDNILLILAGDDQGRSAYSAELQALIDLKGLSGSARLVGHVTDMPAAYLLAGAAAAPSLEPEAFGRTAVEPQIMGRPVLAADHGAVKETVVDGVTGFRVPPGDLNAWTDALARLLALGPAGRDAMGREGQARARALYSLERMTSDTLSVYETLLKRGRR